MRVLVIDDDQATLDAIQAILRFEGHDVLTAHNGAEALAELRITAPDLILLDLIMPIMDGVTFAELYRQSAGPLVLQPYFYGKVKE